jgi:hypothetical protein
VLRTVWDLYARIDGIGLEEYYRDVETRASIGRIAKSVGKPKEWSGRKEDLEELIRRVYIQTTTKEDATGRNPLKSQAHEAILKGLRSGDTVMTFNYDLVIEESFGSTPVWNPSDGYGTRIPGVTKDWPRIWLEKRNLPRSAKSEILLLKLHGSLGWAPYQNGTIKLKPRPYLVRKGKPESVSVLPPGWNKRIDLNPYKLFWREARLRLQKCKSLLIVGYSLPDTDLLARALFAEVVRTRSAGDYLDDFVVVDPDPEVRRKLLKLFTSALGPLCRIQQYDFIEDLVPVAAAPSSLPLQRTAPPRALSVQPQRSAWRRRRR